MHVRNEMKWNECFILGKQRVNMVQFFNGIVHLLKILNCLKMLDLEIPEVKLCNRLGPILDCRVL